jgi:DNA-binding response OmpR family regulator
MAMQALVVCGEDFLARKLADNFGELGLRAECTNDTQSALRLLERDTYQIIVLDCDSEEGQELLEFARKNRPKQKAVLLALVTGSDTGRKSSQLGADFILNKPLESEMTGKVLRAAHTMSIREARNSIRERVHSRATLSVGDLRFEGTVVDVSESGVGLECAQSVEVGKQMQIEFLLPGSERPVRCTGKVVRVEPGRLGIHFLYLSASSAEVVMMWLRTHSPRNSAARA